MTEAAAQEEQFDIPYYTGFVDMGEEGADFFVRPPINQLDVAYIAATALQDMCIDTQVRDARGRRVGTIIRILEGDAQPEVTAMYWLDLLNAAHRLTATQKRRAISAAPDTPKPVNNLD